MASIKNRALTGSIIYIVSLILFFINPILHITLISFACMVEMNKMLKRLVTWKHIVILIFAILYVFASIFLYSKIYAKFGIVTLMLLSLITMSSDSCSCLVGTFFKRKNESSPRNPLYSLLSMRIFLISPNKTLIGFVFAGIGGLLACVVFTYVAKIIFPIIMPLLKSYPHIKYVGVPSCFDGVNCFILGMVAQLGDLIESAVKRQCGVKDSGSILADHGGFCDRYDSMYATIIGAYYLMVIKLWI